MVQATRIVSTGLLQHAGRVLVQHLREVAQDFQLERAAAFRGDRSAGAGLARFFVRSFGFPRGLGRLLIRLPADYDRAPRKDDRDDSCGRADEDPGDLPPIWLVIDR